MFITPLARTKMQKQLKYPSMEKWVNKMWFTPNIIRTDTSILFKLNIFTYTKKGWNLKLLNQIEELETWFKFLNGKSMEKNLHVYHVNQILKHGRVLKIVWQRFTDKLVNG